MGSLIESNGVPGPFPLGEPNNDLPKPKREERQELAVPDADVLRGLIAASKSEENLQEVLNLVAKLNTEETLNHVAGAGDEAAFERLQQISEFVATELPALAESARKRFETEKDAAPAAKPATTETVKEPFRMSEKERVEAEIVKRIDKELQGIKFQLEGKPVWKHGETARLKKRIADLADEIGKNFGARGESTSERGKLLWTNCAEVEVLLEQRAKNISGSKRTTRAETVEDLQYRLEKLGIDPGTIKKQGGYIPKLRELFVEGLRDNTSIPTGKIHEARADLGQLTKLMDEYSSTEKALEPSLPVRGLEGRPAGSTRKIPIEPKKEVTPPPGFEPKPYNFASGESILKESTPPQPLSDEALRGLRGLSRDIKVGGDKDDKKPKLSRQSRPKTVDGDKPERTDTDRKKVAELYVDMNSIFERVRSASPKSLSVVEHETLKGGFEINNRLLLEHYERLKARPPKSAQDNLAGFLEHIESKLAELVALKNQFYELLDEKKSEAVDDMLLEREIEAMRPQINARWREKKIEYYKGKDPSLLEQVLNDTKTQREDVDKVIASLIKRAKENRNA